MNAGTRNDVAPDSSVLIDDVSNLGAVLHEVLHDVALVALEWEVEFLHLDERVKHLEELWRLVAVQRRQLHHSLHLVRQHLHARLLVADEDLCDALSHLGFSALHVEQHVDAVEQALLHLVVAACHALEQGEGLFEDAPQSAVLSLKQEQTLQFTEEEQDYLKLQF